VVSAGNILTGLLGRTAAVYALAAVRLSRRGFRLGHFSGSFLCYLQVVQSTTNGLITGSPLHHAQLPGHDAWSNLKV